MRHYSLRVLFLSCFLGLTAGSVLLPLSSIQIVVQAAELGSQGSQDGVIKACTGQSINLGVPQLTEADLKVLTGCSSGVIPQLIEALKSRDWKVKVIAAHTLGLFEKQAQSVIPELSSLMQDENADVRFAVAQALGDIGTEAVVPVLAKALQDKDENVRVGAADGLLKLISQSRTKSLKALISFFEDRNPKTERKGLHNNTQVESRLVLSDRKSVV